MSDPHSDASDEAPGNGDDPAAVGGDTTQFRPASDPVLPRPQSQSILGTLAELGVPIAASTMDQVASGDRYTVLEELAQGGMGVIFKVRDQDLRRDLAMKVLRGPKGRDPTSDSTRSDPRYLGRFLEEAQVSGQLDHPGIIPIHELGLDGDGRLFFTMRLVRGRTLGEVFDMARRNQNGWSVTRALGVLLKVCEAMAYAHHKRVIHRDLKPANVMVGRFGETYVVDWGLAKLLGDTVAPTTGKDAARTTLSIVHTERKDIADTDGSTSLDTLAGDVVGTPAYMSPEQARGEVDRLSPATDIYAVGALLYHLLTGQPPYIKPGTRTSPHTVLRWVIDGPPTPVAELAPKQPAELVSICERAMERETVARYDSMLSLADDIQAFIEVRVVAAHQSGAVAEFKKWVSRNKGMAASILVALAVALAALGAVGWVQAIGRREVAQKADELASSNQALAGANVDLEAATAQAQVARDAALANERLALSNEARAVASESNALRQSYVANIAAAGTALSRGAAGAARRHLAATDPGLRGWEWKHLSLASDPSLATLTGHQSNVWAVTFSPDGKLLASGSGPYYGFGGEDADARIWDAETGALLHVLDGHRLAVVSLDFSPDGKLLVTGCIDGTVRLFTVADGSQLGSPRYLGGNVSGVRYFADGHRIAICTTAESTSGSNVTEIWNTRTLDVEFRHESNRGARSLALSPDERFLAVGFVDHAVRVWDVASGDLVWDWSHPAPDLLPPDRGFLGGVLSVAFSPDGERLLATSSDNRLRLWSVEAGELSVDLSLNRGVPSAGAWSPDGRWLIVGDLSGALQFFDATTVEPLEVLNGHDQFLTSVAFSPDGSRIASGSWDRTVRLWDGRPGSAVTVLQPRTAKRRGTGGTNSRQVVFSPDGRTLAWSPTRLAAHVIDAWTGEFLHTLEVESAIGALEFTPDGSRILTVTEVEGLMVFDAATGTLVARPTGPIGFPNRVAFNPERTLMALRTGRNGSTTARRIDIYHVETGRLALRLRGHRDTVHHGTFTPDGRRFVSPSADGTIRVWDLAAGEEERVIEAGGEPFRVAITPDGKEIIASSWDPSNNGLHRWKLDTGEFLGSQPGRSLFVNFRMSRDGSRLISANLDGTVGLWDRELGEILTLPASPFPMRLADFSDDGQRISAVDSSGRLFLWESLPTSTREEARRQASHREQRLAEVRDLLDELRAEHKFTDEIITHLKQAPGLDAELRSLAVRDVRIVGDSPRSIGWDLFRSLAATDLDEEELRKLMHLSDVLVERMPGFDEALHVRAWASYRLGRWLDARDDVRAARPSAYSFDPEAPRWHDIIEALIAFQVGDRDAAEYHIREARKAVEQLNEYDPRDAGPFVAGLLREAEAHVASMR